MRYITFCSTIAFFIYVFNENKNNDSHWQWLLLSGGGGGGGSGGSKTEYTEKQDDVGTYIKVISYCTTIAWQLITPSITIPI